MRHASTSDERQSAQFDAHIWGISTVGRTSLPYFIPKTVKVGQAVNGESAQNSSKKFGALAQLVARNVRIVEVRGSNPLRSTTLEKSELNSGRKWVRISAFIPKIISKAACGKNMMHAANSSQGYYLLRDLR